MKNAEFVLRYFTFKDSWKNFKGSMKRLMDQYMDTNRRISSNRAIELKDDFLNTLAVVDNCFGEFAFRRWLPEKKIWRKQVLASLYDAEMFATKGKSAKKV